jgi:PPP family 3-phenylpropionic acid transporter
MIKRVMVANQDRNTMELQIMEERLLCVLYFFLFASYGSLFPLQSLFLEYQGYSNVQIGILLLMSRLISSVAAPILSLVADRTSSHKSMVQASLISSSILTLAWLFMPGIGAPNWPASGPLSPWGLMLASVAISSVLRAPLSSLVDAFTIARIGSRFGEVRLYGALSFGVFSFASAALVGSRGYDRTSHLSAFLTQLL